METLPLDIEIKILCYLPLEYLNNYLLCCSRTFSLYNSAEFWERFTAYKYRPNRRDIFRNEFIRQFGVEGDRLFKAVQESDIATVKYLLDRGVRSNLYDGDEEKYPLEIAVINNDLAMVKLLISTGEYINCRDEVVLEIVLRQDHNYAIFELLYNSGIVMENKEIFLIILRHGSKMPISFIEQVLVLIQFELDKPLNYGSGKYAPLVHAIDVDNVRLVEVLLKLGANPNIVVEKGKNLLRYAKRQPQIIEVLTKYITK